MINVTGDKMECEIQSKVIEHCNKFCPICLQIMGPGIRHGCSKAQVQLARLGRLPRGRSAQRTGYKKRKRYLSELVG